MTCAAPRLDVAPRASSRARVSTLLQEAERRRRQSSFVEEACFDKQIAFIRDASLRKWIFTPRRCGKSTALGMMLLQDALIYPRRKQLYIGLTADTAQNAIYMHILKEEMDKRRIRYRFNGTTRVLTLNNGAEIKFAGMDASPHERDKFLGGKYHRVCVDECQSQTQDLEKLIDSVSPAMGDYILSGGGQIVLAGTPGNYMGEHYWYRLTRPESEGPRVPGWSGHGWSVPDNPHMAPQFAIICAERAALNPNYQDDPAFRSQWLGQWVTETTTHVYKYDPRRNDLTDAALIHALINRLPDARYAPDGWHYIIGVDLGWDDATAISIAAYSRSDRRFFVVESSKHVRAPYGEVAAKLVALTAKWKPKKIVMDMVGGGKQFCESFRVEFKLPVEMAEKPEKQNHIGRMNTDFLSSTIQIIPELNTELAREWTELQIDARAFAKGTWKEDGRFGNHITDATLYAWRESLHHRSTAPPTLPTPSQAVELADRRRRVEAVPLPMRRERDIFERLDEQRAAAGAIARFRGGRRGRFDD